MPHTAKSRPDKIRAELATLDGGIPLPGIVLDLWKGLFIRRIYLQTGSDEEGVANYYFPVFARSDIVDWGDMIDVWTGITAGAIGACRRPGQN